MDTYGRDGRKIPLDQYDALIRDKSYRNIGTVDFEDGWRVTTDWVGRDLSFGFGDVRLLYITVAHSPNGNARVFGLHATEEEAGRGHDEAVKWMALRRVPFEEHSP